VDLKGTRTNRTLGLWFGEVRGYRVGFIDVDLFGTGGAGVNVVGFGDGLDVLRIRGFASPALGGSLECRGCYRGAMISVKPLN
jgi:hypothetical protein